MTRPNIEVAAQSIGYNYSNKFVDFILERRDLARTYILFKMPINILTSVGFIFAGMIALVEAVTQRCFGNQTANGTLISRRIVSGLTCKYE